MYFLKQPIQTGPILNRERITLAPTKVGEQRQAINTFDSVQGIIVMFFLFHINIVAD